MSPAPSQRIRPGALPAALTSFVGRERELAELAGLLQGCGAPGAGPRLLTLAGPGGVGKTRLALAAAAEVQTAYLDGVCWIDLTALEHPDLLTHTVAVWLGVRELPGRPLVHALLAALRSKRRLLVFDNCEHLIEQCAELTDSILRGCPGVRVMATSREPLGIGGETVVRVPPLAVPQLPSNFGPLASQPTDARGALRDVEAVRLFVARAQAALPTFALTEENAPAVAQVCRRLDGLPLALELAATRVSLLSVEELAARLDDRFDVLSGGSRTALARHQTLRATLDWSHALLGPAERAVLRRLAVFAGGFTIAAAEMVCGDAGRRSRSDRSPAHASRAVQPGHTGPAYRRGGIPRAAVLDLLAHLVDKSLVHVDVDGGAGSRCRLLETVRQYALEKLRAAGEERTARDRHLHWCECLVEAADGVASRREPSWPDRAGVERDNLRAALAWAVDTSPTQGLQLVGGLWPFWVARGATVEGRQWVERVLQAAGGPAVDESPALRAARARALIGAGALAREQGDTDTAHARLDEALALSRNLPDQRILVSALREAGRLRFGLGDLKPAGALLDEALALARAIGGSREVAETLLHLGVLSEAVADYDLARDRLEAGLATARKVGDRELLGAVLVVLGRIACYRGDYPGAQALFEEAAAVTDAAASPRRAIEARTWLGRVARLQGDTAGARLHFEAGLALAREIHAEAATAAALAELGKLAIAEGEVDRAAAHLEESRAGFAGLGERWGTGVALHGLALVAWLQGDLPRMAARLRETLTLWRELRDQPGIAACLEGLAAVAGAAGRPITAARLLGAAESLRRSIGVPVPPWMRPTYDAWVRVARAQLDQAAFARARAAGRGLGTQDAIAEALAVVRTLGPALTRRAPAPHGLTPREVEVLSLVAQGASDSAIAQRLGISVRTANTHVARILGKTGSPNRTAAALLAREHGLI